MNPPSSPLRFAALVFLVNRVLVFGTAAITYQFRPSADRPPGFLSWLFVRNFEIWDADWFVRIAQQGYEVKSAAFFPLYPLAMRGVALLPAVGYSAAGLLLSSAASLGLFWAFPRLMELDFDTRDARRITWLLALFPTAFYLAGVYTESLFMLASVLCLYSLRRRRWAGAALFGLVAALTRNTGVLLAIPFLLEFWLARRPEGSPEPAGDETAPSLLPDSAPSGLRAWAPLLWVTLIPVGTLGYMAFLARRFGDPLAFASVQRQYGRVFLAPWTTVFRGARHNLSLLSEIPWPLGWTQSYFALELLFLALAFTVLVASFRRLRLSYWLIILYSLLIPLTAPALLLGYVDYFISFSRYLLVIVPFYPGLYHLIRARWPYRVTLAAFVVLFVVLMHVWSLEQWVA